MGKTKSAGKKSTKVPPPPLRPQNAFQLFCEKTRAKVQKDLKKKGEKAGLKVTQQELAQLWNRMPEKDKNPYRGAANLLQKEYQRQVEQYEKIHGIKLKWGHIMERAEIDNDNEQAPANSKRKRKRKTDPNAPKKPLTAYFIWMNEGGARKALREQHPEMKNNEISTLLGKTWRELPATDKQEWVDKAQEAKVEYQKRLAKYNKNKATSDDESDAEVPVKKTTKRARNTAATKKPQQKKKKKSELMESSEDSDSSNSDSDSESGSSDSEDELPLPKKRKKPVRKQLSTKSFQKEESDSDSDSDDESGSDSE